MGDGPKQETKTQVVAQAAARLAQAGTDVGIAKVPAARQETKVSATLKVTTDPGEAAAMDTAFYYARNGKQVLDIYGERYPEALAEKQQIAKDKLLLSGSDRNKIQDAIDYIYTNFAETHDLPTIFKRYESVIESRVADQREAFRIALDDTNFRLEKETGRVGVLMDPPISHEQKGMALLEEAMDMLGRDFGPAVEAMRGYMDYKQPAEGYVDTDRRFGRLMVKDAEFRNLMMTNDDFRNLLLTDNKFRNVVMESTEVRDQILQDEGFRNEMLNKPSARNDIVNGYEFMKEFEKSQRNTLEMVRRVERPSEMEGLLDKYDAKFPTPRMMHTIKSLDTEMVTDLVKLRESLTSRLKEINERQEAGTATGLDANLKEAIEEVLKDVKGN